MDIFEKMFEDEGSTLTRLQWGQREIAKIVRYRYRCQISQKEFNSLMKGLTQFLGFHKK